MSGGYARVLSVLGPPRESRSRGKYIYMLPVKFQYGGEVGETRLLFYSKQEALQVCKGWVF